MGVFGAFAGGFGQGFLNGYRTRLQAMYYYNMVQYYNYIMRMNNYNPETKTFWDFSGHYGGGWKSPIYQNQGATRTDIFKKGVQGATTSKEGPAPAVSSSVSSLDNELYTWSGKGYTSITPDASYTSPALKGEDKNAFWAATLNKLGAPVTQSNIDFLNGWSKSEGTKATWNPLATTMGHSTGDFNSQGVQNFGSLEEGADFTARTITNGRYPTILKTLQGGDASKYSTREQGDTQTSDVGDIRSKAYKTEEAAKAGGHLRITGDPQYDYPAKTETVGAPDRPIHGGGTHQLDANGQPVQPTIDSQSAMTLAAVEAASGQPQNRPKPGQPDPYWSKNHPIADAARAKMLQPKYYGARTTGYSTEDYPASSTPTGMPAPSKELVGHAPEPTIAPMPGPNMDKSEEALRNMPKPDFGGDQQGGDQQLQPVHTADVGLPPAPLPMVSGEFSPYAPGASQPRYEPQQYAWDMGGGGGGEYKHGGPVMRYAAGGATPTTYGPGGQPWNAMTYEAGQPGAPNAFGPNITEQQLEADYNAMTPQQQNYVTQMNQLNNMATQAGSWQDIMGPAPSGRGTSVQLSIPPNWGAQSYYYNQMNQLTAPPAAPQTATPAAAATTPATIDSSNVSTNVANANTALEQLNASNQNLVNNWQTLQAQQNAQNQQNQQTMANWYANLQSSQKQTQPNTTIANTSTTTPQFGYGYGYTGTGTTANTGRPSYSTSQSGLYGAGGYSTPGSYGVSTQQDILNAPNVVGFQEGGDVSPSVLGPPPGLSGAMGGGPQQIPPYYYNPQTYPPAAAPVGKGVSMTSAPTVMKAAPVPTFHRGGSLFRYEDAGPVDPTIDSSDQPIQTASVGSDFGDTGGPQTGLPPQAAVQDAAFKMNIPTVGGMGMRGPSMRRPPMSAHPPRQTGRQEPDLDVDETKHHDWMDNKPQNVPIEAPMIQDQNGNPSKGVTDALATGIHLLGGLLGLGPNSGGIPTDPTVQENRRDFTQGVGTPSHEQMDTIQDRVDPMHALGEAQRFMAGLEAVYKYDMLVLGDSEQAQKDAAVMLMYARDMASHYGKEAVGYYYHGDTDKMLEAMQHANNYMLNGTNMYAQDNKDGTFHIEARDLANNLMWQKEVLPATILGAALKVSDGSLYWQQLEETAQKYDPTSAMAIKQRQEMGAEIQYEGAVGKLGGQGTEQPIQRKPYEQPSPYQNPISPRIQAGVGAGGGTGGEAPTGLPPRGLTAQNASPLVQQLNPAQPSPDASGAINRPVEPPTSDSQLAAGAANVPTEASQEVSDYHPLTYGQELGKVADIEGQTRGEYFTEAGDPIIGGVPKHRPPPLAEYMKGITDPKARNQALQAYKEYEKEYNDAFRENKQLMDASLKSRTEDWRTSVGQARSDYATGVKAHTEALKRTQEPLSVSETRKLIYGSEGEAQGKPPEQWLSDASGLGKEDYGKVFKKEEIRSLGRTFESSVRLNGRVQNPAATADFIYGFASHQYELTGQQRIDDEYGARRIYEFTRPDKSVGRVIMSDEDMNNLKPIYEGHKEKPAEEPHKPKYPEGSHGDPVFGIPVPDVGHPKTYTPPGGPPAKPLQLWNPHPQSHTKQMSPTPQTGLPQR
jgi:hypothetical protein